MLAAKKYRFIVEVTDMYGRGFTSKRMAQIIDTALDHGFHHLSYDLENIQVKDYNRYEQGLINAEKARKKTETDVTVKFRGENLPPGHYTIVSTNDYLNLQARLKEKTNAS